MANGQLPRVQQLAREIGPASVDPVACDGVPQVFEVNTDLVGAPGFRPALDETEFWVRCEDFPCCLRGARSRPVRHGHALAVNRVPGNRAGDHAGRGARFSPHHGEVGFLGCSLGELPRQRGVRGVVFRHENATACVLVEPVDHARAQRMTGRGQLRRVVHHGVDQCAAPMSRRWVHNQTRWLVQANQVLILVENFQRDVFRLGRGRSLLGRRLEGRDLIPSAHRSRGAGRGAVDRDESGGERFLPASTTHVGPRLRQPAVETRCCRRGGFGAGCNLHGPDAGGVCPAAQGLPLLALPR